MDCRRTPLSAVLVALVALIVFLSLPSHSAADVWLGVDTVGPSGLKTGHVATSLALDGSGAPCVAYYDGDDGDLWFGQFSGGTWSLTLVDTLGDTGQYCSLAIDSSGDPHIAYWYKNHPDGTSEDHLMYASRSGGTWTIETVDPDNVSGFVDLVLDSSDDPHITYLNGFAVDLRYATRSGGGAWTLDIIDTSADVGEGSALMIDASDVLHVAYKDETNSGIKYATNGSGSWVAEPIAGINVFPPMALTAAHISLAMDSTGDLHVVFRDEFSGKTMYSHNTSGAWETDVARSLGQDLQGSSHTLQVGPGDIPTMVFHDNFWQDLRLAPFDGTWWVPQPIAPAGFAPSLVFDTSGFIHVSYHSSETNSVQYAFESSTVSDASPDSGPTRLALTASPNPMFASTTLMFRAPVPMTFELEIIDARGRIVRRLGAHQHSEGVNYMTWDGRDDAGIRVGAGVYFAVSRPENLLTARKVVVVR